MMNLNKLTEPTAKPVVKYSERTDNRDTFLINPQPAHGLPQVNKAR